MDSLPSLFLSNMSVSDAPEELRTISTLLAQSGLSLTGAELRELAADRVRALQNAGRMEFGSGILQNLVQAFRTSPYLCQDTCVATLAQLQELFYELKNVSGETLTDGELLQAMRALYDGPAGGSVEYLEGLTGERLRAAARGEPPRRIGEDGERMEEQDDA